MWTLPGLSYIILGPQSSLRDSLRAALPEAASAILAASLLFLIPIDWGRRRFALSWDQAVKIDWGTILLFGGGLSLGTLAFSTGLATALGGVIETASGGMPAWLIVLFAILVADVMTEFMSNTATANLLIPIFLALAVGSGPSAMLPALAATLGCSLAFCLPVATPPNAIVYGTGRVPLTQMIRLGLILDLGCAFLAWAGLLAAARWLE